MSNVPLDEVVELLKMEFKPIHERLDKIDGDIVQIKQTLDRHGNQLDGLAKDVKTLLDGQTVSNYRHDRTENWAQKAGEKIGVKLEL